MNVGDNVVVAVDDRVGNRFLDDPQGILLDDLEAQRSHLDAAGQFPDHRLPWRPESAG